MLDLNGKDLRVAGEAQFVFEDRLFLSGGSIKVEAGSAIHFRGSPQLVLNGTLELVFEEGFSAQPYEQFTLVHGAELIDEFFANVVPPDLPTELEWNIDKLETKGVVTVVPSQSRRSFDDWIAEFDVPIELRGPLSDASGDGITNLEKYAFGLDPTVSSRAGLPQPLWEDVGGEARLVAVIPKNPDAAVRFFVGGKLGYDKLDGRPCEDSDC